MEKEIAIVLDFKDGKFGRQCRARFAEIKYTQAPKWDESKAPQGSCLAWLQEQTGDYVDVVSILKRIDLWVDDMGLCKQAPYNLLATMLRTHAWAKTAGVELPCEWPPIVGIAVCTGRDAEGNTCGLTAEQAEYLIGMFDIEDPDNLMEGVTK